jgi:hypothetical protein
VADANVSSIVIGVGELWAVTVLAMEGLSEICCSIHIGCAIVKKKKKKLGRVWSRLLEVGQLADQAHNL